jgi:perosamine synthetase
MSVPLFKPSIKRRDMDSVLTCLISDQIGPSTLSDQLISQFAQRFHCRDYQRSIELVFEILDLEEGANVILSPLAPSVYYQIMQKRGLIPLFCQVEQDSAVMSTESINQLMDKNPKAIIVNHPLGLATPMDFVESLDIPLVEDLSQSLGASWNEQPLGSFGDLVLLSMEYNHIITSGGGTLLFSRDKFKKNLEELSSHYPAESFLPDMNASLALVQLEQLDMFLEKRKTLGELFLRSVQRGKHRLLRQPPGGESVWYSLPLVLNSPTREVSLYARKKNVETTLAFAGSVLEYTGDQDLCSKARQLSMRTLLFPLYPMMGSQNAELVSKVLASLP